MAKKLVTKIERFAGMAEDIRNPKANELGNIEHFTLRDKKLIPQRGTEAVETKAYDITKFCYAPAASDYSLYGMGVDGGKTVAHEITDPTAESPTWSTALGGGQVGASLSTAFEYYKNFIYYWQGSTSLNRIGALSGSRSTNAYQTVTAFSRTAQSVHHPADDIFYMFRDNIVAKQTDATTGFEDNIQTIPDTQYISSATAYGNYLAIGGTPISNLSSKSYVYLWNRDSSLTTFSHKYDVGNGNLVVLANVGGYLVAIVNEFMNSTFSSGNSAAVIYRLEGGEFVEKYRFDAEPLSSLVYTSYADCNKQETSDAVYWAMKLVRNNDTITGIWKYDNKDRVSVEYVEEDADADGIDGFLKLGNQMWIAHSGDGSVNRTYGGTYPAQNYLFTSKVDTPIIGDGRTTWQTKGFSVFTEPLPSGAEIVIKYRKDDETTFSTALITSNTEGSIRHEIPQELPHFKEIQFRVESTGGAVITGMNGEHVEISDSKYL